MKKLLVVIAVALSGFVNGQKYEFFMNEVMTSYAYTMNYDSLYLARYGNIQELGMGAENKYVVDPSEKLVKLYVNGVYTSQAKLLSFSETKSQILFSFQDHGEISGKDFIRYGVYNKKPRINEHKVVLYYFSPIDTKTTVCHSSTD